MSADSETKHTPGTIVFYREGRYVVVGYQLGVREIVLAAMARDANQLYPSAHGTIAVSPKHVTLVESPDLEPTLEELLKENNRLLAENIKWLKYLAATNL